MDLSLLDRRVGALVTVGVTHQPGPHFRLHTIEAGDRVTLRQNARDILCTVIAIPAKGVYRVKCDSADNHDAKARAVVEGEQFDIAEEYVHVGSKR